MYMSNLYVYYLQVSNESMHVCISNNVQSYDFLTYKKNLHVHSIGYTGEWVNICFSHATLNSRDSDAALHRYRKRLLQRKF